MKIKLGIILLFFNFNAYSQAPNWKWAIGSVGLADEYIEALTIDSDNNIIIIGQYFGDNMILCNQNLNGSIFDDIAFIAKYSTSGLCDWVRAFGNGYNNMKLYNIQCDLFGNIYVVGGYTGKLQFDHVTVENKKLELDGILIKFNPEGKVLKVKTFDGNDHQAYLLNIKLDKLGNIFVSGITNSSKVIIDNFEIINPRKSGGGNGTFLIKFNQFGDFVWSNISHGQGNEESYGLEIDNNGEILLAGFYIGAHSISFVQFDSVKLINKSLTAKQDIYLYKFDTSGNVKWGQTFGDSNFDEYTGRIKIDSKNNIYLSGTFDSNQFIFGKDTINKIASSNLWDYILMKFDSNGNPTHVKNYFFGHTYYGLFDFAINKNDEISMHFIVSDSIIKVGNVSYKNFSKDRKGLSDFDNLILTIDNSGNYLWSKHYGSESDDQAIGIEYNKDDELIISGDYVGANISFGKDTLNNLATDIGRGVPRNIFIAKLSYDTTTSIKSPILDNGMFFIYPNPVNDMLTLIHNFENSEFLILSAFDITGRQFELEYYLNDNRISIDTRKLTNGIYFIALKAKNENAIEKFVVQH